LILKLYFSFFFFVLYNVYKIGINNDSVSIKISFTKVEVFAFCNLKKCTSQLEYYPAVLLSTDSFDVSSFEACLCACLDYRCFGYGSFHLSGTCQIDNMIKEKPDIANYVEINNDNQIRLCITTSSSDV
jgi:hypothetical protein